MNWAFKCVANFQKLSLPRLIVLNKLKDSVPDLSNLRPIVAAGPLRKLAESLILPELR
jgi:hypothetical protein